MYREKPDTNISDQAWDIFDILADKERYGDLTEDWMPWEDTYPHRDMRFFKDESKGDHMKRMRRAQLLGREEKTEPFHIMVAELLVDKNATKFAALLTRLGMKFHTTKGVRRESFYIA
uniref:Uncharacterized protein n=1 Tax=viral metagenome TaxID=1070528 RepID=A0A6M3LRG2_9ZZZZ